MHGQWSMVSGKRERTFLFCSVVVSAVVAVVVAWCCCRCRCLSDVAADVAATVSLDNFSVLSIHKQIS